MPYTPKLDLSKQDLLFAKEKLFSFICEKAKSWGYDPNVDCVLFSPKQSHDIRLDRVWRVMWESGSYNQGIYLSGGGVTFVKYDGNCDTSEPEIILGEPDVWYLQQS